MQQARSLRSDHLAVPMHQPPPLEAASTASRSSRPALATPCLPCATEGDHDPVNRRKRRDPTVDWLAFRPRRDEHELDSHGNP